MENESLRRLGELRNELEWNPNDQGTAAAMTRLLHELGLVELGREFLKGFVDCHKPDAQLVDLAKELQIPIREWSDPLQSELYLRVLGALPAMTLSGTRPPEKFEYISVLLDTVYGWILKDQERFLFEKVKALPDGAVILEMGACRGKSTVAMAFACVGTRKRIFSVDTFCGNEGLMGKVEEFQPVWEGNLRRFGLEKYATPLRGFTTEMVPQRHLYPPPDFVFIDAAHEYIDVLEDFRNIYPYVKDGGFISFHDVEMGWPGSWRVWKDYAQDLLVDLDYSSSLACGRKVAGRPFRRRPGCPPGFDFAGEVCGEYARIFGPDHALIGALRISLAGEMGSPAAREKLLAADKRIQEEPDPGFHSTLRDLINSKDGGIDGRLRFWYGLSLLRQNRFADALPHFEAAGRVSRPLGADRLAPYLDQIRQGMGDAWPVPPTRSEAALQFQSLIKITDTAFAIGRNASQLLRGLDCASKAIIDKDVSACKKSLYENGIDALGTWDELGEGSGDALLCDGGLECEPEPLSVLRKGFASLAPGGIAIFVVPAGGANGGNAANTSADPLPLYAWNEATLRNLFAAAGFAEAAITGLPDGGGMRIVAQKPA
ncbi:MAG: class I SAM-dependent methyltransferase [Fibrobacteres bacterium]|nr:class I SAM-dependent methyltransferase [Fibrobacterota bacterium]